MLRWEGEKNIKTCDGLTRRDFLRLGALGAGAVSLSPADLRAEAPRKDINCILLFLVGGPSQLDTWDMKPDAPDTIRGPFRPIATNVPGIRIGEHFPRMAQRAHRYAIIRSVHHEEASIHETGQQLMQTGHLFREELEYPHYGAVLSHQRGSRVEGMPPFVVVPAPLDHTGVRISHGQGAGFLGPRHEPFLGNADPARFTPIETAFNLSAEPDNLRRRYGRNTFGQSCLLARRLIEHGVRLVTVNMFDTVFNTLTWDCHADGDALATTLDDYRDVLCPVFDRAYAALLDDLAERGLLESTLVVAMGEFGRTPRLNPRGGRDHWPGVWSILFAGGGVVGGQVVGSSDRSGAEPRDRPVTPAEVAATIYHALGVEVQTLIAGPDGQPEPLVTASPIRELLRG
jgi:hypothetical protein